ncbi:MAG: 2Fe-2S iron-sulfur cluster-binding protein [Myxococcales bacterium]|nr:2Fe-2S iron-sulfur cluster-binding protein [Myxococcales bacterium]
MAKITFVEADGAEHVVDAAPGQSVMESAVKNNVPGITADCGGVCACGTCRVYVTVAWRDKTGGPSEVEQEMIEEVEDGTAGIRLSCQMQVHEEMDGLVVHMPESQH